MSCLIACSSRPSSDFGSRSEFRLVFDPRSDLARPGPAQSSPRVTGAPCPTHARAPPPPNPVVSFDFLPRSNFPLPSLSLPVVPLGLETRSLEFGSPEVSFPLPFPFSLTLLPLPSSSPGRAPPLSSSRAPPPLPAPCALAAGEPLPGEPRPSPWPRALPCPVTHRGGGSVAPWRWLSRAASCPDRAPPRVAPYLGRAPPRVTPPGESRPGRAPPHVAPPGESRPGRAPPRVVPPGRAPPCVAPPRRFPPRPRPSRAPLPQPRPGRALSCALSRAPARARAPAASRPARLARFTCLRHA
jgi:hypothetical protein